MIHMKIIASRISGYEQEKFDEKMEWLKNIINNLDMDMKVEGVNLIVIFAHSLQLI